MVSKTVCNDTDINKETMINSTRMLSIIAADQVGAMDLIINANLKQNSEVVVYNVQSSTSPSGGFFWKTHSVD